MIEIGHNRLLLAIAALGAANAVLRPVVAAIGESGLPAALWITLGVNPAVWAALGLGLATLHAPDRAPLRRGDLALAAGALLGLTIPSATVSWLVLAGYLLLVGRDPRLTDAQRAGALILLVAALRDPAISIAMHLLNEPLLALDAALAAAALAPFVAGVHTDGNLVLGPDGVRLVILTSCSSLANLSYALLFWFAVSRSLLPRLDARAWMAAALIALVLVAQNVSRLALMAVSDTAYDIIHGPSGRLFFETLMLLVVIGLTTLGVRHAFTTDPRGRAAGAGRPA